MKICSQKKIRCCRGDDRQKSINKEKETIEIFQFAGAKALSSQARNVLYNVARQEVDRIVSKKPISMTQGKIITQILQDIQIHIKAKKLLDPVPKTRQVSNVMHYIV